MPMFPQPSKSAGRYRRCRAVAWWLCVLWAVLSAAAGTRLSAADPPRGVEKRAGRLLKIRLPVTAATTQQARFAVRRLLEANREGSYLILEFVVAPKHDDIAGTTEFGSAYDLATFLTSQDLQGVRTVAYVPKALPGHAVLVALACDQIMMAAEAHFGPPVVGQKNMTPTIASAYQEIAARRKPMDPVVAVGMLGAAEDVLQVQTDEGAVSLLASKLPELRQRRVIRGTPLTVIAAGQTRQFSGTEMQTLGFAQLAADYDRLLQSLNLPREAIQEDVSLGETWRAVRIMVKGAITSGGGDRWRKSIEDEIRINGANLICLWIESPGGSAVESQKLAVYLASLDPTKVRTVAYIAREALGDAALVALACDQIVVESRAKLGGPGAATFDDNQIKNLGIVIRDLASKKTRSWSLPVALFDPHLTVFRYTSDDGRAVKYLSEKELQELPDAKGWRQADRVTQTEQPLQLSGDEAAQYRLADSLSGNFAEFEQSLGLNGGMPAIEPSWAESLIETLNSWPATVLLIAIGFGAMYIEAHMPGTGVGAFVATVCFALFFWSHCLGGTAGWLLVMLFLVGLAFIALEIFVLPGYGVFGLGGGVMVLASLILASQTSTSWLPRNSYQLGQLQQSLWMVAGAGIGVVVLAMFSRRWLPHAPLLNQMLLQPPSQDEAQSIRQRESLLDVERLIGAHGITTSQLIPGGKARFGNRLLDVIADGEEIPPGVEIVVVEVHGNRLLVQEVTR